VGGPAGGRSGVGMRRTPRHGEREAPTGRHGNASGVARASRGAPVRAESFRAPNQAMIRRVAAARRTGSPRATGSSDALELAPAADRVGGGWSWPCGVGRGGLGRERACNPRLSTFTDSRPEGSPRGPVVCCRDLVRPWVAAGGCRGRWGAAPRGHPGPQPPRLCRLRPYVSLILSSVAVVGAAGRRRWVSDAVGGVAAPGVENPGLRRTKPSEGAGGRPDGVGTWVIGCRGRGGFVVMATGKLTRVSLVGPWVLILGRWVCSLRVGALTATQRVPGRHPEGTRPVRGRVSLSGCQAATGSDGGAPAW